MIVSLIKILNLELKQSIWVLKIISQKNLKFKK